MTGHHGVDVEAPLAQVAAGLPGVGRRQQALQLGGQGERALDKVLDAAKNDPSVYYLEASINPNGVEIGKVLMKQAADSVKKCSMELGGNAP